VYSGLGGVLLLGVKPIVMEAPAKIKEYFPSERLVLDIALDPEYNKKQELDICICTNLSGHEAFEKLNILVENWWLDAFQEANGKIDVHIEFE
jgi:hypothetical protein